MKTLFLITLFTLFTFPAFGAGVLAPIVNRAGNCVDYSFPYCKAADDCDRSATDTSDVYVPNNSDYSSISVIEDPVYHPSSITYSCEFRYGAISTPSTSDILFTTLKDYTTGNPILITDVNESVIFEANMFSIWWIHCATMTGGTNAAFRARVCR